jgi:phage terminase small subunit
MAGRPGRSGGWNRRSLEDHLLHGTFNPTRHRPARALQAPPGEAIPPDTLSSPARAIWASLAPLARHMGTLTVVDTCAFATFCELEASMAAARVLKGSPETVRAGERQELRLAAALRPFYALFGFDPVSRARLAAPLAKPLSKWGGKL